MSGARQVDCLPLLQRICEHYALPASPELLLQGLPVTGSVLPPPLLGRAADNAGLVATEVPAARLADAGLPALGVAAGEPVIVRAVAGGTATAESADGATREVGLAGFEKSVFTFRPRAVTDARSETLQPGIAKHWLRQEAAPLAPWYRDLVIASLVINVLGIMVPLFTMNVYDRVVPNLAFDTLWVLASGVLLAIGFDWLLRQARTRLADVAGRRIDVNVSAKLFSRVLGMKLEHKPASTGAFAKQIQEFDTVRDFLTSASLVTAIDLPFTLIFLLVIGYLGGNLVLIPLAGMTIILAVSYWQHRKLGEQLQQSATLSAQRQAQLIESLNILTEAKQVNAEGVLQRKWEDTVAALSDWNIATRRLTNSVTHTVLSVQQAVIVGLILGGVYRISGGLLSMGGLIAVVMLSGRASAAVNQLAQLMMRFEQTRTALRGLEATLKLPQEKPAGIATRAGFSGRIELRGLNYNYPEQSLPALNNVSLTIAPGERIAVVGPAGAGKSTLLSVLAGQFHPPAGQVYIDNVEYQQWSPQVLRSAIAWVPQQPALMYGSLLANITLGQRTVDQSKLAAVLQLSGINLFMDRLENGLETQVGELGMNLSRGQRQAVALARAFLRDAKLLLLDEPTGSLDQRAENQLVANLRSLPAGTGFVLTTHRPGIIAACERVIVLDRGEKIADLSADEFLKQASGRVQKVSVRERGREEQGHE